MKHIALSVEFGLSLQGPLTCQQRNKHRDAVGHGRSAISQTLHQMQLYTILRWEKDVRFQCQNSFALRQRDICAVFIVPIQIGTE